MSLGAPPAPTANIASHLRAMARLDPSRPAIIAPASRSGGLTTWTTLSFGELEAQSDAIARGLEAIGIGHGNRCVLMVPPSPNFFALVFGLFKVGAAIVLIDPGLARRQLLSCLAEVEPQAFIGVPKAHVARLLFPRAFRSVRATITVGARLFWGGHALEGVRRLGAQQGARMGGS